jgi:hypothetical protein
MKCESCEKDVIALYEDGLCKDCTKSLDYKPLKKNFLKEAEALKKKRAWVENNRERVRETKRRWRERQREKKSQ